MRPIAFYDPAEVYTWSECRHLEEVCPESGPCDDVDSTRAFCALDSAASYVPIDVTTELFPFPWSSDLFELPRSSGAAVPGATGWTCISPPIPYDYIHGGGLPLGDSDGFTNLVDCNNEDDDIVPVVPSANGYDQPGCEQDDAICYVCPPEKGSDDDDSATEPAGDDDSCPATPEVERGCAAGGCGFSWPLDAALALIACSGLGGSLRRRRQEE